MNFVNVCLSQPQDRSKRICNTWRKITQLVLERAELSLGREKAVWKSQVYVPQKASATLTWLAWHLWMWMSSRTTDGRHTFDSERKETPDRRDITLVLGEVYIILCFLLNANANFGNVLRTVLSSFFPSNINTDWRCILRWEYCVNPTFLPTPNSQHLSKSVDWAKYVFRPSVSSVLPGPSPWSWPWRCAWWPPAARPGSWRPRTRCRSRPCPKRVQPWKQKILSIYELVVIGLKNTCYRPLVPNNYLVQCDKHKYYMWCT